MGFCVANGLGEHLDAPSVGEMRRFLAEVGTRDEEHLGHVARRAIDSAPRRSHAWHMASSERVQRAMAAASELSRQEREELITELLLSLEHDRDPEIGYDEAWSSEIRRRVDAAVAGTSKGAPWAEVRREIEAELAERRRRST